MAHRFSSIFGCLAASLAMACLDASTSDEPREIGLTSSALSVCNETVPANRNVDGIPAYAQCADSNNAAIYSNNGVDTATTQMGSDWVRTQWSGGYQCTEFAHRYLHFKWGVKWIPNGNAGMWCDSQPPANSGLVQTMTPVHGDIMVLAPGSCGADATTGHVNIVDQVNGTKLVNVEQNGARRGNYMLSCAKCFLHVMANDGSGSPATAGAAGAAAPGTSGAPTQGAPGTSGAPMQGAPGLPGAAGAAAPSSGRPQRPSMSGAQLPGGAAGAAAPSSTSAAAGSGAMASRPTLQPPVTPSTTTSPSMPLVNASAAAGSGASAPLASAVTAAPSTTRSAPMEAGCSIATPRGTRNASMPIALALSVLGGMILHSRRRR